VRSHSRSRLFPYTTLFRSEVLDLPAKIITVEIVELDKEWQRNYDEAWDRYIAWVESHPEGKNIENILSAQALVELMKLKQVCSRSEEHTSELQSRENLVCR